MSEVLSRDDRNTAAPKHIEFMSDEFMMYCYKIAPCTNPKPHVWSTCPFGHTGERASRRDLRVYQYSPTICPYMRNGIYCPDGDICCFSHHVFESCLHPSRFKTELCNKGTKCTRRLCFFAHGEAELRSPSSTPPPPAECLISTHSVLHKDNGEAASHSSQGNGHISGLAESLKSLKVEDLLYILLQKMTLEGGQANQNNVQRAPPTQHGFDLAAGKPLADMAAQGSQPFSQPALMALEQMYGPGVQELLHTVALRDLCGIRTENAIQAPYQQYVEHQQAAVRVSEPVVASAPLDAAILLQRGLQQRFMGNNSCCLL